MGLSWLRINFCLSLFHSSLSPRGLSIPPLPPSPSPLRQPYLKKKKKILYWSIVDLQCCVSVRCTAKWFSYTYFRSQSQCDVIVYHSAGYGLTELHLCFLHSLVLFCITETKTAANLKQHQHLSRVRDVPFWPLVSSHKSGSNPATCESCYSPLLDRRQQSLPWLPLNQKPPQLNFSNAYLLSCLSVVVCSMEMFILFFNVSMSFQTSPYTLHIITMMFLVQGRVWETQNLNLSSFLDWMYKWSLIY